MRQVSGGSEEGGELEFEGESRWCCSGHPQGWRREESSGERGIS